MENEIRLVLLVVGVFIILAILWDGLRRQQRYRRSTESAVVPLDSEEILQDVFELDVPSVSQKTKSSLYYATEEALKAPVAPQAFQPQASVEQSLPSFDEASHARQEDRIMRSFDRASHLAQVRATEIQKIAPEESLAEEVSLDEMTFESRGMTDAPVIQKPEPVVATPQKQGRLIMFTLVATGEKTFGGFRLLQSLLNARFRFGEGNIFHYHENNDPHGKVLFSLAAATPTGEFNLSQMANFSCKGLVIFTNTQDHLNPKAIFNEMVTTTEALAEILQAERRIGQTDSWSANQLAALYEGIC